MPPDVIESLLEKVTSAEHRILFMLLDARLTGLETKIETALATKQTTSWADVAKEGVLTLRQQPLLVVAVCVTVLGLGAGGLAHLIAEFTH